MDRTQALLVLVTDPEGHCAHTRKKIWETSTSGPPVHTPVEEDESALIASAKNGEAQAFEVLVARHRRRVLAIALRYARVRQDAEDIMQQSFQKPSSTSTNLKGDPPFQHG